MTPYYESGGITIYHGDCRDVLRDVSADVLITDPPYGVGMVSFNDDFSATPEGLRIAPGTLAAVFMSPRRVVELAREVDPWWTFERLLWMHKAADIAAPWRGWCMNSEAIMVFSRVGAQWPAPNDYRSDIYTVGPWERSGHPNAKPIAVVRDLVRRLTCDGVVLDPFMGSGTTLRAAKDLGRRAIGIEIEERYCEIAAKRLMQEAMDLAV
jgi:site-specific DNA-methyltransferase (adenine-specific)